MKILHLLLDITTAYGLVSHLLDTSVVNLWFFSLPAFLIMSPNFIFYRFLLIYLFNKRSSVDPMF